VKTYKITEACKEFITGIYSSGDFIGYMELLKDTEHTDSAQTLEHSEIFLIPKQDFQALVFENRDISAHFIKLLSGHLIDRERQLLALAYDTVRKRVADALLKIHTKFTEEDKENFSISREDIANMVGTATESVIRSLSEFKKDGYIQIESNKIKILDLKALKDVKF
jgi:CRP-like cAMP-binding protein